MGALYQPFYTEKMTEEFQKRMKTRWEVQVFEVDEGSFEFFVPALRAMIFSDKFLNKMHDVVAAKGKNFDARPLLKKFFKQEVAEYQDSESIPTSLRNWNHFRKSLGLKPLSTRQSRWDKALTKSIQNEEKERPNEAGEKAFRRGQNQAWFQTKPLASKSWVYEWKPLK